MCRVPGVAPVMPKPRCGAKSGTCPARNAAFDTQNGKRCVESGMCPARNAAVDTQLAERCAESGISSAKSVKGDLTHFDKITRAITVQLRRW